jgi:eukaryotic-like serine/threonine-protein kinase
MVDQALSLESLIGLEFSHYRIIQEIGSGGMGVVFRAHDQHLDREVAIKVLHPGTITDEGARKHLHKEALALSKLNHPNIATIHDFDCQRGIDFLVMEYIPGVTLNKKLAAGPLRENEVVRLAMQLSEGLTAAHEHGVVHRDLKPGNLQLTSDGRLKILDFGLARLRQPLAEMAVAETTLQTQSISGTFAYMAPEQLMGEELDPRTDIHGVGLVLYEMATGQRPFAEVQSSQLIGAILRHHPTKPRKLNPKVSAELERIICKCLEKNPENRYQSARELVIDLRRLEHHTETGPSLTETSRRQSTRNVFSHRQFLLLVSAVILILAVASTVLWRRHVQRNARPVIPASIAVLPFSDLSPGHDKEYFSDGLAEEILNDLAKVPNLKVVARSSAFQFKGKDEDLRVIGQKLKVDNVVEGSVRTEGTRVRITAQLVKTDDGFHLWSDSYDRDVRNVLTVQDDIARAVTSALQFKLTGVKAPAAIPTSQTTSPEAYQEFLQSRYFANRIDRESRLKALDHINRAIQNDSRYAAAYALRGELAVSSGAMDWMDYSEARKDGQRDAEKAIQLDPNLANGYLVLSMMQLMVGPNCRAAKTELKRAMELAPGNADGLGYSAVVENCLGHQQEAVELVGQALALDPLVATGYKRLAQYLRDMGRYEDSLVALERALDLNPQEVWVHETWGEVYLAQGRPQEALTEMVKEPPGCFHDLGMALAFHALAREQEADAAVGGLISGYPNSCAYQIAEVYAYRGETDQSFEWLKRAFRQHDAGLIRIKTDLLLKMLRGDPRYDQMLKTLNLPS